MKYNVYIIQSEADKSYYVESSFNLYARLWEHNYGRTGYTREKRPWKLMHKEEYKIKKDALVREKQLKRFKSKKYIENLIIRARSSMVEQ